MAKAKPSQSKAPKKSASPAQDFYAKFFKLVETRGWFSLTLPEIATATGVGLPQLLERYPDKSDILNGFGRTLDLQLAQDVTISDDPLKDKLFDLVMQRLDALRPYRGGILRLIGDIQAHPVSAVMLGLETMCGFNRSMALMLDMSGKPISHPSVVLAVMGLKIVYVSTLRTWKHDESADLSATMAILDRGLNRLIKVLHLN